MLIYSGRWIKNFEENHSNVFIMKKYFPFWRVGILMCAFAWKMFWFGRCSEERQTRLVERQILFELCWIWTE